MRKIVLGLFLLVYSIGFTQTYKFGVLGTTSLTTKSIGTITINDKKVLIESEYDGKKSSFEYDLLKKTNGLIYFTDGVMTHFFSFVNQKGTKKGFDYDTWIVFNTDKRQGTEQIIYYCKLQE